MAALALLFLVQSAGVIATGQASKATATKLEPLIEARVVADSVKRSFAVDVFWPPGLKPRIPRDDGGVLGGFRTAALTDPRPTFTPLEETPDWAGNCERSGCRIAYGVDYGKGIATDKRGDWGFEEKQRLIMAPLARWLVRPEDRRARGRLRLDFDGGRDLELVSGVMDGRTNHIDTDLVVMDGPHVVLGAFDHRTVDLAGGRIDIAIARGLRAVRDDDIVEWVREGALDVMGLLGRFPLSRLQVIVGNGGSYAIGSAVTMGMGGASIFIVVGEKTNKADLLRDWVMTHEMLHVAFPNMGSRQRWMEEGLSTYFEPLLRARRGRNEPSKLWAEFIRAMPQGLPKEGDQGLDRTFTWGRRYWGGALFWFMTDLEIRKRTEGARSLDDVVRAILANGGSVAVRWDVSRLATVAESATGTTALREIYDEWSMKPVSPDLAAVWSSLGVRADKSERISYDETAPLASTRREMTLRPASSFVGSRP